jgi:type II restriction enzyme
MATAKQELGAWGEKLVAAKCTCPKCKRPKTLKLLPPNFKCADLICDFCGFLAQVKAMTVSAVSPLPKLVPGAAWRPQKERMDSGIYFPLFLALKAPAAQAVYYLPVDFQSPALFSIRNPLSASARRAGWQSFKYVLGAVPEGAFVRLL